MRRRFARSERRWIITVSRMKSTPLLALLFAAGVLCGCASHRRPPRPVSWQSDASVSHPWGYYTGQPLTKWNPDGRTMTLVSELCYTDPRGAVWVAPAGSVVDGASIPKPLWSFMGGPFEGKYRNASVLHDVAYSQRNRPPEDCDRMFYDAMRCSGVGALEAKTMYYALLRFGWHWKFAVKRAKPVKVGRKMVARAEQEFPRAVAVDRQEIQSARSWIGQTDPTIEQIEHRVDAQVGQ